jgi:hypothetical protein
MTCQACMDKPYRSYGGVYQLGCLLCCTRLVASTRPSKQNAESMLAVILRTKQSHGREDVLREVKSFLSDQAKLAA